MNRRAFVNYVVNTLPFLVFSKPMLADTLCGPPTPPWGAQACMSGIKSVNMNVIYDPQHQNEWCWAACISMVFDYYQHPICQNRIVAETWGSVIDMPGQPQQILHDLNRQWTDDNGQKFTVTGDLFSANPITAAQDLSNNRPLIICSLGHAMVFTRLDYLRMPNGSGTPTKAWVRDPWPGMGLRSLTPQEWYGQEMLIRIKVYPA